MSQLQVTGEAKIRDIQGPVVANSGVITALDGAASQYVRGDGTLADFPTSSGGGSSVSYYLNSSVSQGTIGGVAYRELSKEPIIGAGTDIAISANGYVASYLTDANDPDVILIPGGNFNCEFYFSVNNNTGNPFFYAELYKYDGTTFTLLGSSVGVPEYITQGTVINPYYFAIPVATANLALTDRLAIRIYVNVDGRTVTLHTENGHLCQVVTTLSKGMVSLNNLTDQSQFITTGTSGTNFAIVSSGDTHTFNLPVASATNTGKLSSTDWSTFNNKLSTAAAASTYVPYTGANASVDLGAFSLTADTLNSVGIFSIGSGTQSGYIGIKQGTTFLGNITGYNSINANGTKFILISDIGSSNYKSASFQLSSLTNNTERTYTLPNASGTLALTSDISYPVTSVFGRTGAIVAVSGDYNTSQVTENTNLYFTDARSRAALSFTAGSGAYNSTTGVITIPTNNNQITNGSNFITLTSLSAGTGISYNNTTGVITNSAPDQTVSLTAGAGISISGTYPSFTIASTITQYTDALARAAISLTTTGTSGAATYNSTTGVFNIPNYAPDLSGYVPTSRTITINGTSFDLSANRSYSVGTVTSVGLSSATSGVTIGSTPITTSGTISLAIATASGSQNGLLSSTDWTTFNNKQSALTNPVTGTGTTNYLPKFTGASTIGDSVIQEVSSNIGIGVSPSYKLDVNGAAQFRDDIRFSTTNSSIGYTDAIRFVELGVATRMTLSSGNLGLGVTPNTWTLGKAIQIGALNGLNLFGGSGVAQIGNNVYYNGGYFYGATGTATLYTFDNGGHNWAIAPSGTAGNAISFTQAMTLFSTGNLAVGTTTDAGYKLDVNGTVRVLGSTSSVLYIEGNVGNSKNIFFKSTGAADNSIRLYQDGGTNNFIIATGDGTVAPTNRFTIASTGAATFSSSLTIGNTFNINTEAWVQFLGNNVLLADGDFTILQTSGTGLMRFRNNSAQNLLTLANNGTATFNSNDANGWYGGFSNSGTNFAYIGATLQFANSGGTATDFGIRSANAIAFYTSGGNERMRITSGGKVNINNTSNTNYQLYVDGGSSPAFAAYSTSPNNQFKLAGTAPGLTISNTITSPTIGGALGACTSANDFITGTAAGDMILINQYTGNKLYITNYSGGVYLTQGATSWTANSDIRIKNINSHITNAVEKLSTLQTINFCYKDDISKKENLGLIAQEVEMVFPELIETNNDGILGVRYTELIPVLIEAIKEQQEQIKELKLELDKIKNK
jgi:hypothetical protein